ncbi:hypothetical protein STEG23_013688 [Scotinomys teguina]
MEVKAAAPHCQLLLIVLMAVMLLLEMKASKLLVQRTVTQTIVLQETIGKEQASLSPHSSNSDHTKASPSKSPSEPRYSASLPKKETESRRLSDIKMYNLLSFVDIEREINKIVYLKFGNWKFGISIRKCSENEEV